MTEPTLERLTQRLDQLERQSQRLKGVGVVLLLALAAVGSMGQTTPRGMPKVVEAESFPVRNAKGDVVAELGGDQSGHVGLYLRDQNKIVRVALSLLEDGSPVLNLTDQTGKTRAALTVMADGTERLFFLDQKQIPRATLFELADGSPGLSFVDQNRNLRATLILLADSTPGLGLYDEKGKASALLSVERVGPRLVLRDEDEKTRAVLGHTGPETKPGGTTERRPASSLMLLDKDDKVLWRAP